MTEAEWLTCDRPELVLANGSGRINDRTLRLFSVACCWRLVAYLDARDRQKAEARLQTAERFADGLIEYAKLRQVQSWFLCGGGGFPLDEFGHDTAWDDARACASFAPLTCWRLVESGLTLPRPPRPRFLTRLLNRFRSPGPVQHLPHERPEARAERIAQAALVRCIFGNPFRPVAFDPAWRTDTAVALARQMYDSRDFGVMPILADALQDAGCEDEQVLSHCRDAKQIHARGCWVCDAVLGKA